MTAAHCLERGKDIKKFPSSHCPTGYCYSGKEIRPLNTIKLVAGEQNTADQNIEQEQELSIAHVIIHPEYWPLHKKYGHNASNDIAIIKLENPVVWTDSVRPVCLPEDSEEGLAETGHVVGWGIDKYHGSNTDILHHVELDIVDNAKCQQNYQSSNMVMDLTDGRRMCAGGKDGKDSCQVYVPYSRH